MTMRRDYVKLAGCFLSTRPDYNTNRLAYRVWESIVLRVSDTLKEYNPTFDEVKFLGASGLTLSIIGSEEH